MSFNVKAIGAFAGIIVLAILAIFLLRSSDEKAIQQLLEDGAAAASKKDAEAVVALVSPSYKNGEEDYAAVTARIRKEINRKDRPPISVVGAAIEVDGGEATALVSLEPRLGPYKGEMIKLRLQLRKESEAWKVTWAEWVR